jgi:hypothetical protein
MSGQIVDASLVVARLDCFDVRELQRAGIFREACCGLRCGGPASCKCARPDT